MLCVQFCHVVLLNTSMGFSLQRLQELHFEVAVIDNELTQTFICDPMHIRDIPSHISPLFLNPASGQFSPTIQGNEDRFYGSVAR